MGRDTLLWPARTGQGAGRPDAPLWDFYEAALMAVGEEGYEKLKVGDLLERSGAGRSEFERWFNSKEDCFAAAYGAAIDCAVATVLGAGASQPDWRAGFRAALVSLFSLVVAEPVAARALLVQVHLADGGTREKRRTVVERLSRAVESARRETGSRHSSSPLTGTLIIGAIEATVCSQLQPRRQPGNLWEKLPELVHFAVLPYFGEDAAWEDFEAARVIAARMQQGS
jgi:AcrR family transcriptional regulator